MKSKGVVAVLTGADAATDKIGMHIPAWTVTSKDGSPMKVGAFPALAHGKACFVGDPVAVVIAQSYPEARDAAEKVEVQYSVLEPVVDLSSAAKPGQPQIHDFAPNNTVFNWHLGDKAATDAAFAKAAHVTKLDLVNNRTIPNAIEPRAGDRRLRFGNGLDDALLDEPESTRRQTCHVGLSRRCAGKQVACDRSRRGRRFRLEDFHLQ